MALAGEHAEPGALWRLLAPLEQPLHPQADAEQRTAVADVLQDGVDPRCIERARGAEMAHARHDHAAGVGNLGGRLGNEHRRADGREGFLHRRQISRAVVDERDGSHRSPFVLGSIRASRLSVAHATRSARANALNAASTL